MDEAAGQKLRKSAPLQEYQTSKANTAPEEAYFTMIIHTKYLLGQENKWNLTGLVNISIL